MWRWVVPEQRTKSQVGALGSMEFQTSDVYYLYIYIYTHIYIRLVQRYSNIHICIWIIYDGVYMYIIITYDILTLTPLFHIFVQTAFSFITLWHITNQESESKQCSFAARCRGRSQWVDIGWFFQVGMWENINNEWLWKNNHDGESRSIDTTPAKHLQAWLVK